MVRSDAIEDEPFRAAGTGWGPAEVQTAREAASKGRRGDGGVAIPARRAPYSNRYVNVTPYVRGMPA